MPLDEEFLEKRREAATRKLQRRPMDDESAVEAMLIDDLLLARRHLRDAQKAMRLGVKGNLAAIDACLAVIGCVYGDL